MRYLPNAKQMQRADAYTIQELHIPSLTLMERAARACVDVIFEEGFDLTRILVVCGSGNNGGDGFAIARMLRNCGHRVAVCFCGNPDHMTKECRYQKEQYDVRGGVYEESYDFTSYSLIVDAIFGVGLNRRITGSYAELIKALNAADAKKFSVDIPSGVSADTGQILGIAFRADVTVYVQQRKRGTMFYPGRTFAGKVLVRDIGITDRTFSEDREVAVSFDRKDISGLLPVRTADSHKGTYGKVLFIAGSKGMCGASYLNAKAAYLCGAGLVRIYTAEENRVPLQTLLPEAIITTYTEFDKEELLKLIAWADVIGIGSGLGRSETAEKLVKTTLQEQDVPCMIDADAVNILSDWKEGMPLLKKKPVILTPHMKELSGLTGKRIEEIKEDRITCGEAFVRETETVLVMKDSVSCIFSPTERTVVNTTGNQSMAKGGAGDVLSGMITGFLAGGISPVQAAVLGTYLHGLCGDLARKQYGDYSVLASHLMEAIPEAIRYVKE